MLLVIVMGIIGTIIMGILFYNSCSDSYDAALGGLLGLCTGALLGLLSVILISSMVSNYAKYETISTEHIELVNQNGIYVVMMNNKDNGIKYAANEKYNPASSVESYSFNTKFTYENPNSPFVTITHTETVNKIWKYISWEGTKTQYNYHIPEGSVQILNLGF